MHRDDDRQVDLLAQLRAAQSELRQLRHVRVVVGDVAAALAQQLDDLQRRRLAQVADPRLVGDAQDQDALNDRGIALKGAKVLVLGVAYKKDIDDMRESPALKIIRLLRERGAEISYSDPYVPELPEHDLTARPLEQELEGCDCAVIVTAHPGVDHAAIARDAPATVDLRGVTRQLVLARARQL